MSNTLDIENQIDECYRKHGVDVDKINFERNLMKIAIANIRKKKFFWGWFYEPCDGGFNLKCEVTDEFKKLLKLNSSKIKNE